MAQERGCRTVQSARFDIGNETIENPVESRGLFEVGEVAGTGDHRQLRARDHRAQFARKVGRGRLVLVAAQHERRNVDVADPVALVGEPHPLGSDAISGGGDARHGLDHFAANLGVGGGGTRNETAAWMRMGEAGRRAITAALPERLERSGTGAS